MKKSLPILFLITAAACKTVFSQNLNIALAAQVSYGSESLSNICGWVDTADGKEYALVGAENGLSVVDVTVPAAPVKLVQIPGPASTWREIKTWGDYAYVTTEDGKIGLQIVELTNLPATNLAVTTWKPKIGTDSLETIHALHIDNGKVYLYGSNIGNGGAIIADIATSPMAPVYLGSYDPKYIHDGYVRNDTMYAGHIYDGECAIVNAGNPASPVLLASFNTPTLFTHNTWLTADSRYCFTTDENNDSYLGVFDVSNLSNISETDRIQSNPGSNAVVHNTHVLQVGGIDYAVTSWYNDGFTIVDGARPHNVVQVGNYDTAPTASGSGMNHCWGVYPFLPSGTIVASDMQNGLFVLDPTYVRACYLEGVVTDCGTNNPVAGVNVAIQLANPQSDAHLDVTDFLGQYAVGVAVPDTYLVVFSKIGFISDTDTVVLTPGTVVIDSVKLCPVPTFAYTGHVFDLATSAGIPGANVAIFDSNSRWDTITDASGNFMIPNLYSGTFTITAGQWRYVTKCYGSQSVTPTFPPVNIGLNKGIYDDFMWDWGWTVSGNATDGMWERGEPLGTTDFSGSPANPDFDVSNDCGDQAYVTGNTGTQAGDDDVDGGSTILTSPVFDLSAYYEPYLFYSRWKRLSFNSNDTVIISVSNGTTTVTLENVTTGTSGSAAWANRNYKLSSYIPLTSTMTFSMKVSDLGSDNTNEGGLDKFFVVDSSGNAVNETAYRVSASVFPNPSVKGGTVTLKLEGMEAGSEKPMIRIFDLVGKQVYREILTSNQQKIKLNIPSGLYLYQISCNSGALTTGKLCIE